MDEKKTHESGNDLGDQIQTLLDTLSKAENSLAEELRQTQPDQETGRLPEIKNDLSKMRNILAEIGSDVQSTSLLSRDVLTEREKVEQELKQSNEKLRLVLGTITDAYISLDRDWRFVEINRTAVEHYLHRPTSELIGKMIWEEFPEYQGTEFDRQYHIAMDRGTPVHFEEKAGETGQWYEVHAYPVDERLDIYLRDITDRKRLEERFKKSEERLRELILYAPAAIYEIDIHTNRFINVNDVMVQYLGYSREELLAMDPSDLMDEQDKQLFQDRIRKTLAGISIPENMDYKVRAKDGHELYAALNVSFSYKDGKPDTAMVIAHDITERKKWEVALEEANQKLEERVEKRTQELHAANQELRHNAQRLQELVEISRLLAEAGVDYLNVMQSVVKKTTEIVGDACILRLISADGHWLDPVAFYNPDPEAHMFLESVLKTQVQRRDEGVAGEVIRDGKGKIFNGHELAELSYLVNKEYPSFTEQAGSQRAIIVPLRIKNKVIGTLELYKNQPGEAYHLDDLLLFQDLADRAALAIFNARLYRDLEKALVTEKILRQKLVQSEKYAALARLVASVAHELNNPIQTIQNCMFILNEFQTENSLAQNTMEMAISEAKRVARLVEQLRETYRPSKTFTIEPVDIVALLQSVKNILEPYLQHNHAQLNIVTQQKCILVNGIADQIKQVFLNISLNAIEAMQPVGGTLDIEVSLHDQPKQVTIKFTDNGPGIQEEYMSRLFEPFYTTKPNGTGLGLPICYEIVQDHSGKINVESRSGEEDHGATFTVWLPVHVAD